MTPGARAAAAIAALDRILHAAPAEQVLTGWARGARYAGSGDRAAVRDLVFDALRKRRSAAAAGGSETGRAVLLGLLRLQGTDPDGLFSGEGHAPPALTAAERRWVSPGLSTAERLDCPDWLLPHLSESLGEATEEALCALRERAPVFLRAAVDRQVAARRLAEDAIATAPHPEVRTALEVTGNERKLRGSAAFRDGLVELQDASSQAAVLALPLRDGMRVLDYCAGGGGKSLAMAARNRVKITAHDADPARMADLPARAARAGVEIALADAAHLAVAGPFDLALVDVPCSGSGTWRRTPDAKWRLTPSDLERLTALQDQIVDGSLHHVRPGGWLVYMTCSLLAEENEARVEAALSRHADLRKLSERRWLPGHRGDGFFLSILQREATGS